MAGSVMRLPAGTHDSNPLRVRAQRLETRILRQPPASFPLVGRVEFNGLSHGCQCLGFASELEVKASEGDPDRVVFRNLVAQLQELLQSLLAVALLKSSIRGRDDFA